MHDECGAVAMMMRLRRRRGINAPGEKRRPARPCQWGATGGGRSRVPLLLWKNLLVRRRIGRRQADSDEQLAVVCPSDRSSVRQSRTLHPREDYLNLGHLSLPLSLSLSLSPVTNLIPTRLLAACTHAIAKEKLDVRVGLI